MARAANRAGARARRADRQDDDERPVLRLELTSRGVLVLIIALAVLWALVQLWSVFILVVISVMLATALLPFVDWLMERGLGRGWAVGVVIASFLLIVAGLGLVVVPDLISQGQSFRDRFPELRADIVAALRDRGQDDFANRVEGFTLSDAFQRDQVVNTSRYAFNLLVSALTVIVLTVYLLADAPRIRRFFYFCVPDRYEHHVTNLLPALRTTVGGYLRGQLVTSLAITIFTYAVLLVMGVPDALGIAVLAGIADVIPLIGAFIAVVPATFAALGESTTAGIVTLVLLLVYQQFEDRFLVPRVYGRTLRLPAVAVFLAVIIGANLMGILGALLALPAAAAIRVFVMYGAAVRQGRVEPIAPDDELFAPDEVGKTPATAG
jgi:predicted PurR-regulated permease PerM